jgi:hypothetical protein
MNINFHRVTHSLPNPSAHSHARDNLARGQIVGLAFLAVAAGCFPPPIGSEGDETSDSETGNLGDGDGDPGDGDGDPGDGDGDPCGAAPIVTCTTPDDCWASDASWTAEARATEADHVVAPGIWVPYDIGDGYQCWELDGVGTHACIVETCGANLLGTPADEMPLEPDPSCEFTGVWESTALGVDGCYGIIHGVAVKLRDDTCVAELPDAWGEELADVWLHSCDINGTTVECCAAVRTEATHMSSVSALAGGLIASWGDEPLFAGAGMLEKPWVSDGSTRTGRVHWDHCGLPPNGDNPTTRTFELHATDHELGVTDFDSVTMEGGQIECPNDWPCDAEVVVDCGGPDGCWASSSSWTGKAKAITQESVDAINAEPELFPPVALGVGDSCWQVGNSSVHICVVTACGMLIQGQPVADFTLAPAQPGCDFVGPWETTATVAEGNPAGGCVGVIDGVVFDLLPE